MAALFAPPAEGLTGLARVPGDKSISHRALILGGLAVGETRIEGLLEGEDVLRTAAAMRALGAELERQSEGSWRLFGRGLGGLVEPDDVLDLGNTGTGVRLLMGLVAGHPITVCFTGDASLRRRPMGRVVEPLEQMGAQVMAREACRLPLILRGSSAPQPIRYALPVASAQVKSAILLAALNAPGRSCVIEPAPSRDHSERMLAHFGAEITVESEGHGRCVTLIGQPELHGRDVRVPADPSSAAFPLVAALLLPGSALRVEGVGVNPLRCGLFETLREMGAELTLENRRDEGGEPVADLVAATSRLRGITVPAERAPSMIDEYPILAVAAALASGTTVMQGLGELRVKESDRLSAMARGLAANGVEVEVGEDSLTVHGRGARVPGGGTVASELDHRIAMSFAVLGLASDQGVTVDDAAPIETSFPGFTELLNALGAQLRVAA